MKFPKTLKFFLAGLVVIGLITAFSFIKQSSQPANQNGLMSLQAPSFVFGNVAYAQGSPTQSIADEAGVSVYYKTTNPIDLAAVRSLYRTIETDTSDYIIGSIEVPGYGESWDVNAYIHVDGWILVYYPNDDNVGKIFDYLNYNGGSIDTKLNLAFEKITTAVGLGTVAPTYYDFRYPNATNMLIIADYLGSGTDTFTFKLPQDYQYYEGGWAYRGRNSGYIFYLNGNEIARSTTWGTFDLIDQLRPNQTHSASFDNYSVAIILLYSENSGSTP